MSKQKNSIKWVGKRIRILRQDKGISVTELAEQVDVSKSYLSHIETGTVDNPTFKVLEKLADSLNVSLEELFSEQTESEKRPSIAFGHPSIFDEMAEEKKKDRMRYKRAVNLLEEVLTNEGISSEARRELAEEIISLVEWAKKWANG